MAELISKVTCFFKFENLEFDKDGRPLVLIVDETIHTYIHQYLYYQPFKIEKLTVLYVISCTPSNGFYKNAVGFKRLS
jgi:hypothetical protein